MNLTAVILAGGKGARMAPYTGPKCLIPVKGIPILHRLIRHLSSFEFVENIVVCVGYKAQDVENALNIEALQKGMKTRIGISSLDPSATMCQRLKNAYGLCHDRTLVCYGDEMADVDLKALIARHERDAADITVTGCHVKVPFGVIGVGKGGRVTNVDHEVYELVNIGFTVVEKRFIQAMRDEEEFGFFLNRWAGSGKVAYYIHDGKRVTVNSLPELEYAEAEL